MYKGQLRGGPDDGNHIESDFPMITAVFTAELRTYEKSNVVMITKGSYIWDPRRSVFNWRYQSCTGYTKEEYLKYLTERLNHEQ